MNDSDSSSALPDHQVNESADGASVPPAGDVMTPNQEVSGSAKANSFQPPFQGVPLPTQGALLGIDHGEKRLGFAISTTDQTLASPLENYTRRSSDLDARRLRECVVDYRVKGIVIGLPLHVGGDESTQSHKAREFGRWVQEQVGLPVTFWDERYSSTLADDFMLEVDMSRKKRKQRRDMLAAHLFLQSYLDRLPHLPPGN